MIYDQGGLFEPSGIKALQVLASPPELEDEPWLVPVGPAYRVEPDPAVTSPRTIAFTYLQRDVPEGWEHTLDIYFLSAAGEVSRTWQVLPTRQYTENLVVADLQPGPGTYAVLSTVELPVLRPGWNALAYPLPDARPVEVALRSIQDHYTGVYTLPAGIDGLAAWTAAAAGGTGQQEQWLVPRRALSVRAGPAMRFPSLGTLAAGQRVRPIGPLDRYGWRRIVCPPGLEAARACWIPGSRAYVTTATRPVAAAAPPAPPAGAAPATVLRFGHVYLVYITGSEPQTVFLAPPLRTPEGRIPGSR
jgi:hypothetical protein